MTIMSLVPNTGDELPSRQISRRIRGLMAENRISGVKLAAAIGMNQKAFSRRYADEVDWSIDELALVARSFGMSLGELCAIRDSNPEPADSALRQNVLSIVGRIPIGEPLPAPPKPQTPLRHLALVGGAA